MRCDCCQGGKTRTLPRLPVLGCSHVARGGREAALHRFYSARLIGGRGSCLVSGLPAAVHTADLFSKSFSSRLIWEGGVDKREESRKENTVNKVSRREKMTAVLKDLSMRF